jgi:hypothetical protein
LAAALHFIEREQGFAFLPGSLRVSYVALEGITGLLRSLNVGTLFIDVDSARNLELVRNNVTHKTHNTLYGVFEAKLILTYQASSTIAKHPWVLGCSS